MSWCFSIDSTMNGVSCRPTGSQGTAHCPGKEDNKKGHFASQFSRMEHFSELGVFLLGKPLEFTKQNHFRENLQISIQLVCLCEC